jgi:hypothetical protein
MSALWETQSFDRRTVVRNEWLFAARNATVRFWVLTAPWRAIINGFGIAAAKKEAGNILSPAVVYRQISL